MFSSFRVKYIIFAFSTTCQCSDHYAIVILFPGSEFIVIYLFASENTSVLMRGRRLGELPYTSCSGGDLHEMKLIKAEAAAGRVSTVVV